MSTCVRPSCWPAIVRPSVWRGQTVNIGRHFPPSETVCFTDSMFHIMCSSSVFHWFHVPHHVYFSFITIIHLGFVHPLQDVALHQCLPLSSVCCFPNPGGSLLICYVVLPSSAWSSSGHLPSPWLPLCASLCPPIVL